MTDKEYIFNLIEEEKQRQENEICLIASENYMSEDVIKACGSALVQKYAEGYPEHRFYGGCSVVDKIENIAIEEAKELFNCKWANVQPNSGCQANQAVYMSICKPKDTILAMGVNEGGHISHSLKIGFAGTFYNVISYGLDENGYINYNEIEQKLYEYNPKLLIVGGSAYPRTIDFERIRSIVDEYNNEIIKFKEKYNSQIKESENPLIYFAPLLNHKEDDMLGAEYCYIMVDMAHISGLVGAGLHPSPIPYADVVTSTVQKTLRSGRGGLILSNDEELGKKIDKAIFPCLQGGPLMNMIAGKAVGFAEALTPEFKKYQEQVLKNVQAMVEVFNECGIKLITGGSDNHLILIDLREENFSGKDLETVLEKQGIITNKNAVVGDTRPKSETSGLRIGTPAITTRGALEQDAHEIALYIAANIDYLRNQGGVPDAMYESGKKFVKEWCKNHPIYK